MHIDWSTSFSGICAIAVLFKGLLWVRDNKPSTLTLLELLLGTAGFFLGGFWMGVSVSNAYQIQAGWKLWTATVCFLLAFFTDWIEEKR